MDENNYMHPKSYIPLGCKNGTDYIDKMNLRDVWTITDDYTENRHFDPIIVF